MHVDCMPPVGQLKYPNDVAVDSCGNILVMDGVDGVDGAELRGLAVGLAIGRNAWGCQIKYLCEYCYL